MDDLQLKDSELQYEQEALEREQRVEYQLDDLMDKSIELENKRKMNKDDEIYHLMGREYFLTRGRSGF